MVTKDEIIEDLIEHNDELENYFRNTIIPQLYIDGAMILKKFTPPAMKQFDLKLTDVGRPISDIRDNFRFPSLIENIESVNQSHEILEKEIQTNDLRWYQMNILPYIIKKENRSDGVIVTFVEITYRIRDLKEQEKLISDHETLLDTISHDIRNPLSNMILAIDQFKIVGISNQEKFEALLSVVERALNKMKSLIQELSETREDEHRYRAHVELLNFEHVWEDVRLSLSDDILSSGAIIKVETHASEVNFSRRKLRSILYNILLNSIKYRSPDRKLEIRINTIREQEYMVISITDNGIGIDPSQQEAVFSKYFRLDNSIEGAGIGLYLVKELITNAGGRIQLDSTPGKGTTVSIYLKDSTPTTPQA